MLQTLLLFTFVIFVICIICIILLYLLRTNESKKMNYFNIHNITQSCANSIYIDEYLPDNVGIKEDEKGWGLVSKTKIKKGDIVYMCPVVKFPGNVKIISAIGEKDVDKNVHMFDTGKLDIFPYFDILLNHSNTSNAFHDVDVLVHDDIFFITLLASRDIEPDEEITIHYLYEMFYYVRAFVVLLLPEFSYTYEYPTEYLDRIAKKIKTTSQA